MSHSWWITSTLLVPGTVSQDTGLLNAHVTEGACTCLTHDGPPTPPSAWHSARTQVWWMHVWQRGPVRCRTAVTWLPMVPQVIFTGLNWKCPNTPVHLTVRPSSSYHRFSEDTLLQLLWWQPWLPQTEPARSSGGVTHVHWRPDFDSKTSICRKRPIGAGEASKWSFGFAEDGEHSSVSLTLSSYVFTSQVVNFKVM